MAVGGSGEGAKQSPRQAECRCSMLFEIQGMLKIRERLKTFQMCEGGSEKSYESGRTSFWNKGIQVWRFPSTSWLVKVRVAKRPSRHFSMLFQHSIVLTKHGYSSIVSYLLEDVLLHRPLHHSALLPPQRKENRCISRTTAR